MVEETLTYKEIRDMSARTEQKREEFCHKIEKAIPKLKKEIADKNTILVKSENLGKKLGLGFSLFPRHPTAIYWDAKYCLWKEGIYVGSMKKDHKKIVLMRTRTSEDKLPKELIMKR